MKMPEKLRKLEKLFYIAVALFIATYFTISSLQTEKVIHSVIFTILAIILYMFAINYTINEILRYLARTYFDEEYKKDKIC